MLQNSASSPAGGAHDQVFWVLGTLLYPFINLSSAAFPCNPLLPSPVIFPTWSMPTWELRRRDISIFSNQAPIWDLGQKLLDPRHRGDPTDSKIISSSPSLPPVALNMSLGVSHSEKVSNDCGKLCWAGLNINLICASKSAGWALKKKILNLNLSDRDSEICHRLFNDFGALFLQTSIWEPLHGTGLYRDLINAMFCTPGQLNI